MTGISSHQEALEAATDLWDAATNAVCQTMQDRNMCNCPDGDCLAAKVNPAPQDFAWFSQQLTVLAPADNGLLERLREHEAEWPNHAAYYAARSVDLISEAADTITAQAAEIERLRAERDDLAVRAAVIDEALTNALQLKGAAEARLSALEPLLDKAVEALEPFASLADGWVDDEGWTDLACKNDRLCDWFGPSDFRSARSALTAIQGGCHAGE
ncbi:hypothetical protein [Pseudaminobacter sp. NGMCC 1.201702]|uniref:hypothetical protein n=1 Tax=Pseudaminobacter sp. NGMCC 1.201702 TaxID=3391825 RepID=UPI0039EFEC31